MNEVTPAQFVQLALIDLACDFLTNKEDSAVTQIGLVQMHVAAMFMKRPEFMYKIFNDLHTLEGTGVWLDDELDQLEAVYNG